MAPVGEQRAQPPDRAKQVHSNRRLVQAREGAHFTRGAPFVVAQHEHRALSIGQPRERVCKFLPAFSREDLVLGGGAGARDAIREVRLPGRRLGCRDEPPLATGSRLDAVQAPVDQYPGEPDLERELLPERRQVRIGLDERVLHRLVGFGAIPEVVERDPGGPALVPGHEVRVPLPCLRMPAFGLHRLDGRGRRAVSLAGR